MNEQSICLLKVFSLCGFREIFWGKLSSVYMCPLLKHCKTFRLWIKVLMVFFNYWLKIIFYHRWATHSWFCFFNPIVHIKLQVNPLFWQHLLFSFNVTSSGIASASGFGEGTQWFIVSVIRNHCQHLSRDFHYMTTWPRVPLGLVRQWTENQGCACRKVTSG